MIELVARTSKVIAVWVTLATACSGAGGPAAAPADAEAGGCGGGGLPPRRCGAAACSCCTGCSVATSLCFGSVYFALGTGECVAVAGGALQVTIGATTFVADEAAAVVDGAYMEIVAHAATQAIALRAPAVLGTHTCDQQFAGAISYFPDGALRLSNLPTSPRPPCTVTVTSVGAVGDRIEGAFAATVSDGATSPATTELTGGTFSVVRAPFP